MAFPDAVQKIEQARVLIEEARSLVEEKHSADKSELEELKKKLKEKEKLLLQKDRELQRKEKEVQARDRELKSKTKALEESMQPLKDGIRHEIRQSYAAVLRAKEAHLKSPSKYTAGFIELAKGSHSENEEMLSRLAQAVGLDIESLKLKEGLEADEDANGTPESVPPPVKKEPREKFHLSRYTDRNTKIKRRDSATA